MMTVGEHDSLWKEAAKATGTLDMRLENIKRKLSISNMIEITKEMYTLGKLSKEEYSSALKELWSAEGSSTWEETFSDK